MGLQVVIDVAPLDVLWRVSAMVGGKRAPQYLRQFATHAEATAYAETLANVLAVERFKVRIHNDGSG